MSLPAMIKMDESNLNVLERSEIKFIKNIYNLLEREGIYNSGRGLSSVTLIDSAEKLASEPRTESSITHRKCYVD